MDREVLSELINQLSTQWKDIRDSSSDYHGEKLLKGMDEGIGYNRRIDIGKALRDAQPLKRTSHPGELELFIEPEQEKLEKFNEWLRNAKQR